MKERGTMLKSLGVDLGNVIIDHVGFGTTREFVRNGDYNSIPAVPGVFEALRQLNQLKFSSNIFVVYNATNVADQKIISWLQYHNFFKKTGISTEMVMRTQNGRDKSALCKKFGATHFIDDRLEALSYLIGKVENLYLLRPQQTEVKQHQRFLPLVQQVSSWNEVIQLLLP